MLCDKAQLTAKNSINKVDFAEGGWHSNGFRILGIKDEDKKKGKLLIERKSELGVNRQIIRISKSQNYFFKNTPR